MLKALFILVVSLVVIWITFKICQSLWLKLKTSINGKSGKLTILTSGFAAFISMYLGWAEILFYTRTGARQGLFLLLFFWLYPFLSVLLNFPMNKKWGLKIANYAIITSIVIILIISFKSFYIFNISVGLGAWLFLGASIALWIGVNQNTSENILEQPNTY